MFLVIHGRKVAGYSLVLFYVLWFALDNVDGWLRPAIQLAMLAAALGVFLSMSARERARGGRFTWAWGLLVAVTGPLGFIGWLYLDRSRPIPEDTLQARFAK